jgi:uncharacterized protein (DUF433 family)
MEYPHIVRTPGVCSGLPRIDGTRITVNLIAREVVRLRRTPEEVLIAHPHLTLAQIHAALAYYFDHRAEVNAALAEADRLEADLRARFPSRLEKAPLTQP